MKTVNIKGKQYVEVKERVRVFHEQFPKGSITTELLLHQDKIWVVKATVVTDVDNPRIFTGLAQEVESDNYKDVNHTSALENAETSAVGRAMAFLNIGVVDSIASVDEMNKAQNRSKRVVKSDIQYNPDIHGVVKMKYLDGEEFFKKIREFELIGGGYNGEKKIWFLPKVKIEELKQNKK